MMFNKNENDVTKEVTLTTKPNIQEDVDGVHKDQKSMFDE